MQPGSPKMTLQEQCSLVQEKILATREKLRQACLEHELEGRPSSGRYQESGHSMGACEHLLEDGSCAQRFDATRPATAELKSSCGVDDEGPEEGDGIDGLQSSSSSDDARDSDSDEDGDRDSARDMLAEPPAPAAPRVRELAPPRELFTFKTEEPDPLLVPPKVGKDHSILYPPPRHIDVDPPEPEPLRVNADIHALVAQCMAADAERLQNPSL